MSLVTPVTDWSQGGSINETTMERIEGNINKIAGINKVYTATGTGAAIIITTDGYFAKTDGVSVKFMASANNSGAATTANVDGTGAVPVYKPGTTSAPTFFESKAYELWYNVANACFFFKASAEGTVPANYVLTGYTFSNNNDTGIPGSMVNNGAVTITPSASAQTIPLGWHNGSGTVANLGGTATAPYVHPSYTFSSNAAGRAVAGTMTTKAAATITPSTSAQTIAANQYLTGVQTISSLGGNVTAANVRSGYTFSSDSAGRSIAGAMSNYVGVNQLGTQQGVGAEGIIYVQPPTGYWEASNAYIQDADFVASNIPSGKNIFGLSGTALMGATYGTVLINTSGSFPMSTYGEGAQSGVIHDFGASIKALSIVPVTVALTLSGSASITSANLYSTMYTSLSGGDNLKASNMYIMLAGSVSGSVLLCGSYSSCPGTTTQYGISASAFRVGNTDTWYVSKARYAFDSYDEGAASSIEAVTLVGNLRLIYSGNIFTYNESPILGYQCYANAYYVTG